jgi:hypothetical protein
MILVGTNVKMVPRMTDNIVAEGFLGTTVFFLIFLVITNLLVPYMAPLEFYNSVYGLTKDLEPNLHFFVCFVL